MPIDLTKIVLSAKDETAQAFRSVESNINSVSGTVRNLAGVLGVSLSAAAFVNFIKGSIDAADRMNDLSKITGTSVETLSGFRLAAEQSGTSLDAVATASAKLGKAISEHPAAFRAAGVTATDTTGAMVQLADIFASMPDGIEKSTLAQQAFGKSGAEMIPLLNEGSAGLQKMIDKGRQLAPVTAETAAEADKFNDDLAELKMSASGLGISLASELLPQFNQITLAMKEAAREGGLLKTIWVGLGGLGTMLFTDDLLSRSQVIEKELTVLDAHYRDATQTGKKLIAADYAERIAALKEELKGIKAVESAEKERADFAAKFEKWKRDDSGAAATGRKLGKALGGGGGDGGKPGDKEAKEEEQARLQWHTVMMNIKTRENDELLAQEKAYQDALTGIKVQEFDRRMELQAASTQTLIDMLWAGKLSEIEIESMTGMQKVSVAVGSFGKLIDGAGQHSRAMFNLSKAAALAEGAIELPKTVMSAFAKGTSIGGPILGAAFAAVAGAAQLINLNAIRSAQFGGGGGAAPSAGGTTGLPGQISNPGVIGYSPPVVQGQIAAPLREVNINMRGTDVFSPSAIRDMLIPALNDALGDGVRLNVQVA